MTGPRATGRRWAGIVLVLLLPLGALAWLAVRGQNDADRAQREAERVHRIVDGDCVFFAELGTVPLPTGASSVARNIVDSARSAYASRCTQFGPLPPAPTITPPPTPSRPR